MLPGAGHGPFGNVFDIVAYELAGAGKRVFRVETWESREELEAKSLDELHAEVDAAVDYLRSNGCSTVDLIAKSFGGGVALSHDLDAVDRLLLWAPAVEVGVDAAAANDPGEEVGESEDVLIGIEDLDVDVLVRILVGDEDRGVSVDDCRRIADAVGDGDMTVIPGENHSFNENRTAVVEHTLRYLSS
ncbi:alpha/beta hydrolase [Halostella sp. JP-L12]|uniref:alpha/beta fold hydrolase n=1 Tax=Halostella TaxID=1843185 RepID=UPI000EF7B378|nr:MULTISPECIES: alpha/beta hydrolase [Halostella]NHN48480.1 alpha/beta hydrolase [Halostella sp. JP-L12]